MDETAPQSFDPAVIAEVAVARSIDESSLVAGVVAVQDVVAGFSDLSVDDIVYEWRTQHHKDPLVSRTPRTYYLDVREHVWDDIFERADVTGETRSAIRAVHATQFGVDPGVEDSPAGAMVLDRT